MVFMKLLHIPFFKLIKIHAENSFEHRGIKGIE